MVARVLLWSFQPLARVAELEADGELTGSWDHVPASTHDCIGAGYRAMVAAMAGLGVSTDGRPPVWAWSSRSGVTVSHAHVLVGDPLWDGYATIEFVAPEELVVVTDYGAWNDHLEALFLATDGSRPVWDVSTPVADEPAQVCLPVLRAEWVREIRPLARSEHEIDDWEAQA